MQLIVEWVKLILGIVDAFRMFIPKRYGESKTAKCPFCEKASTARNDQGVPVCETHRNERLRDVKCVCGDMVEILVGKWGPYGKCDRCGSVSWSKLMGLNNVTASTPLYKTQTKETLSKPIEKKDTSIDRSIGSNEYRGPGVVIKCKREEYL